jgi:hypothetical protein
MRERRPVHAYRFGAGEPLSVSVKPRAFSIPELKLYLGLELAAGVAQSSRLALRLGFRGMMLRLHQ